MSQSRSLCKHFMWLSLHLLLICFFFFICSSFSGLPYLLLSYFATVVVLMCTLIIWVLQPVTIISLILSRVKRKVWRKFDTPKKQHLSTSKQNLACLLFWCLSHGKCELMCAWRGCASLAHHRCFSNSWGLATLTNLNTEMCICHTKFGKVMLVCDQS